MRLRENSAAVDWKGLAPEILTEAGVTCRPDGVVHVPYRETSGTEVNAKLFAQDGRCWWERSGQRMIPFGLETLAKSATDRGLLIAEGCSDTLALRAAFRCEGYHVLGIPGAHTWRPEWARYLSPYPVVYVLGDGDEAGRRLGEAVRADRPDARVVPMPEGRDARALLQSEGWWGIGELLEEADRDAAEREWLLELGRMIVSGELIALLAAAEIDELPRAA